MVPVQLSVLPITDTEPLLAVAESGTYESPAGMVSVMV